MRAVLIAGWFKRRNWFGRLRSATVSLMVSVLGTVSMILMEITTA
jgi:hypothetical protein